MEHTKTLLFPIIVLIFGLGSNLLFANIFQYNIVILGISTAIFIIFFLSIMRGNRWGQWLIGIWLFIQTFIFFANGLPKTIMFSIAKYGHPFSLQVASSLSLKNLAPSFLAFSAIVFIIFSEPLTKAQGKKWLKISTVLSIKPQNRSNRKALRYKNKDLDSKLIDFRKRQRQGTIITIFLSILMITNVCLFVMLLLQIGPISEKIFKYADVAELISEASGSQEEGQKYFSYYFSFTIMITFLTIYFIFFLSSFIMIIPIVSPIALRWKDPLKFLALRPFNRSTLTGLLIKSLRKNASGFGHIYTISDKSLRIPWYIRFPLFLGQISLFSFRFRIIQTPNNLDHAIRNFRRKFLRNLNWFFSLNKIFPIACTDESWKTVVSRMICEADFIIIDLTGLSQNIVWELEQCHKLGRGDRVVLVCNESQWQEVNNFLLSSAPDIIRNEQLYSFSKTIDNNRSLKIGIARKLVNLS